VGFFTPTILAMPVSPTITYFISTNNSLKIAKKGMVLAERGAQSAGVWFSVCAENCALFFTAHT